MLRSLNKSVENKKENNAIEKIESEDIFRYYYGYWKRKYYFERLPGIPLSEVVLENITKVWTKTKTVIIFLLVKEKTQKLF